MPGKASVGPLGMGGTNALYSKRNVAQSSTVSQTPFSTAPNRYAAAGLLSSIDCRDAHPAQPIAECRDAHTAHFMTGRISSKVGALAFLNHATDDKRNWQSKALAGFARV